MMLKLGLDSSLRRLSKTVPSMVIDASINSGIGHLKSISNNVSWYLLGPHSTHESRVDRV